MTDSEKKKTGRRKGYKGDHRWAMEAIYRDGRVQHFNSMMEASAVLNISGPTIKKLIQTGGFSVKGMRFVRVDPKLKREKISRFYLNLNNEIIERLRNAIGETIKRKKLNYLLKHILETAITKELDGLKVE